MYSDISFWRLSIFWAYVVITIGIIGVLLYTAVKPNYVGGNASASWKDIVWGIIPLMILIGLVTPTTLFLLFP